MELIRYEWNPETEVGRFVYQQMVDGEVMETVVHRHQPCPVDLDGANYWKNVFFHAERGRR